MVMAPREEPINKQLELEQVKLLKVIFLICILAEGKSVDVKEEKLRAE